MKKIEALAGKYFQSLSQIKKELELIKLESVMEIQMAQQAVRSEISF